MSKRKVKQQDISDCGAACLSSIASHYKLHLPIAKIRQIVGTNKNGTNLLGLVEGAEKIGFDAKGVKGHIESLSKVPIPAIAHITLENDLQHYIVIYKVSKKSIRIMDPGSGDMSNMPLSRFMKLWTGILVILLPSDSFSPGNQKIPLRLRLWQLLKPHKFTLIQAFIGALFYTLLGFSTSIYIQKITDQVLETNNSDLLNTMSVFMLIILIAQILLSVFKDLFLIRAGQEIDARLILGYFKHLLKLPQKFFDTMRVGEIISRINDAVKIRVFISNTSLTLMVNFMIVLFSFLLMFTYYWKLGLLMLTVIPLYLLIFAVTNAVNKKTERKMMEAAADVESQLVSSLNSIATIKQFSLEDLMQTKTEIKFIRLLKEGYRSSLNHLFSQSATQFISGFFTILLLWVGSYYVMAKELSPGELLSFFAILGYFTGPVTGLISSNKLIQNALIAADRLFEILDLEISGIQDQFKILDSGIKSITFKSVVFRYDHTKEVFSDLNLHFQQGEITAIVGESGSGKSTVIKLIQGLYQLNSGQILLNGVAMTYYSTADLNARISIVPQKVELFSGTIFDNISIGSSKKCLNTALRICKSLNMLVFIENLPNGFNTVLDDNGSVLSGGQKQMIAIARALYLNPDVLILDEATSSLDSHAEYALQRALQKLINNKKIIILITHRLMNLSNVDRIIVLEQGKLAEQGSHSELMNNNGVYRSLWERQIPSGYIHMTSSIKNFNKTNEKP